MQVRIRLEAARRPMEPGRIWRCRTSPCRTLTPADALRRLCWPRGRYRDRCPRDRMSARTESKTWSCPLAWALSDSAARPKWVIVPRSSSDSDPSIISARSGASSGAAPRRPIPVSIFRWTLTVLPMEAAARSSASIPFPSKTASSHPACEANRGVSGSSVSEHDDGSVDSAGAQIWDLVQS